MSELHSREGPGLKVIAEQLSSLQQAVAEIRQGQELMRVMLFGGELNQIKFDGKFARIEAELKKLGEAANRQERRIEALEIGNKMKAHDRRTAIKIASVVGTGVGILGDWAVSALFHRR